MTSTIEPQAIKSTPELPFIGKTAYGLVVLFNSDRCGTVLNPGNSDWVIGTYGKNWIMDDFEYFTGTIKMQN